MLGWLLLILVGLGVLFLVLQGDGTGVFGQTGEETGYIIAVAALLACYAVWLLAGHRGRFAQATLHLSLWAAILLALVTGYSYRGELTAIANRVAGELAPPGQTISVDSGVAGERAVRIRRRPDGHFIARAEVNGTAASMLVDTGASTVVLRPIDAQRAGIDADQLSFTVPVQTANGTAFAAPVRVRSITIGAITLREVEALVAKPGSLNENLLGMSFLTRLKSYEFSGEFLTLRG